MKKKLFVVVSLLGLSGVIGLQASQSPKTREALCDARDSVALSRSVSQELLRRSDGVKKPSEAPMASSNDAMKRAMIPQDHGYFPGSGNLILSCTTNQIAVKNCPSGADFNRYFYNIPNYEMP
jgi:hypothetical protein